MLVANFLLESNAIEGVTDSQSLQQALKAWQYITKWKELTGANILRTHAILMKGKLDRQETGAWRRCQVWIGGREGKPWYAVPDLMSQWIKQANHSVQIGKEYSEEDLQRDHVDFEKIHPFVDGNGRMGRILMNWQRVKIGKPVLVIKEELKHEYYKWFK